MDRGLVQAKQSRSYAESNGRIVQGTAKTAARTQRAWLVRLASGHTRHWRARGKQETRAGSTGWSMPVAHSYRHGTTTPIRSLPGCDWSVHAATTRRQT